jgi:hypothetical protein
MKVIIFFVSWRDSPRKLEHLVWPTEITCFHVARVGSLA